MLCGHWFHARLITAITALTGVAFAVPSGSPRTDSDLARGPLVRKEEAGFDERPEVASAVTSEGAVFQVSARHVADAQESHDSDIIAAQERRALEARLHFEQLHDEEKVSKMVNRTDPSLLEHGAGVETRKERLQKLFQEEEEEDLDLDPEVMAVLNSHAISSAMFRKKSPAPAPAPVVAPRRRRTRRRAPPPLPPPPPPPPPPLSDDGIPRAFKGIQAGCAFGDEVWEGKCYKACSSYRLQGNSNNGGYIVRVAQNACAKQSCPNQDQENGEEHLGFRCYKRCADLITQNGVKTGLYGERTSPTTCSKACAGLAGCTCPCEKSSSSYNVGSYNNFHISPYGGGCSGYNVGSAGRCPTRPVVR